MAEAERIACDNCAITLLHVESVNSRNGFPIFNVSLHLAGAAVDAAPVYYKLEASPHMNRIRAAKSG